MPKLGKILSLLAAVALWQGCSSTSDNGDAATFDAAADGPNLFLSRGMNDYTVTMVANVVDPCLAMPSALLNHTLAVNFVLSTQMLSVGTLVGSPLQASLGTGVVGTTGTLNRDNQVTDLTCTWHQTDVSLFTLTGGDVFTLDVTETQNSFTTGCGTDVPAGGACTSTFTLTFANPTPRADGGV